MPGMQQSLEIQRFAFECKADADIQAGLDAAGRTTLSARSLAIFTQSTLQGAFVLAKAGGDPTIAADCCDHLTRYLEQLFIKDTAQ